MPPTTGETDDDTTSTMAPGDGSSSSSSGDGGSSGSSSGTAGDGSSTTGTTAACDPEDLGSALGEVAAGNSEDAADGVEVSCIKFDSVEVEYVWTAPADGTYQIDTFGSQFDTALVVLAGGTCDGKELACNDDMDEHQAGLLLDLLEGESILVVVDGWGGATGEFVLNIVAAEANDCCATGLFPGCEDPDCEESVCAIHDGCCDDAWTSDCATTLAPVLCQQCAPDQSCCFAQDADTGCEDAACEAQVCAIDPTCCDTLWSQSCADQALATCLVCNAGADCCEAHPEPGCSYSECEQAVCDFDPWCCSDAWEQYCADDAMWLCDICM